MPLIEERTCGLAQRLQASPARAAPADAADVGEIGAATLAALIALVHRHTGITMSERKSMLLQRRLQPRLRMLGLGTYQAYLDVVKHDAAEVQVFINMVTTNDTAFFRTPHVWTYFSDQFLPQWMTACPGKSLNVWSAAAASGEEAYSIAMLCDRFQALAPGFDYRILATDISTAALATARAGVYTGRSLERLRADHPALLQKYFTLEDGHARAGAVLRTHVRFAEHSLLTSLQPHEQFDIIFLRNVLIYFADDQQKKVVDLLVPNLRPGSKLILGESESLSRIPTHYRSELPLVYGLAPLAA